MRPVKPLKQWKMHQAKCHLVCRPRQQLVRHIDLTALDDITLVLLIACSKHLHYIPPQGTFNPADIKCLRLLLPTSLDHYKWINMIQIKRKCMSLHMCSLNIWVHMKGQMTRNDQQASHFHPHLLLRPFMIWYVDWQRKWKQMMLCFEPN